MTRAERSKVKQVFAQASTLQGASREDYLAGERLTAEIRREVDSLLAQHDKAEDFPGVYSSVGGRRLSHYEIFERIGEGGMAMVYRAQDTTLRRPVALKVLQPWAMGSSRSHERLIAEARAASALNHPNIVTVYEAGNAAGVWFIAMEFVSGTMLDRWIPRQGAQILSAIDCAAQIADALATAHASSIVHGDLKPANVMVTGNGRVKVLDFGLARMLHPTKTDQNSSPQADELGRFGTKAYMSPEQLLNPGAEPDQRSDIFSFGLILHQILTGEHAFGKGTREEIAKAIRTKSPAALPDSVPASLARVVAQCLEKDPKRRFESMQEVHSALLNCEQSQRGGRRGQAPRAPAVKSSHTVLELVTMIERIGFDNIPKSRRILTELARAVKHDTSEDDRQTVTSALKALIQTNVDVDGNAIPAAVRELRKSALQVLKIVTGARINACFEDHDLEFLDLYGMNFAGEDLRGFSFRQCFLVEADFQGSHLSHASFADAPLRNTNFALADLTEADFAGADWFNALNLTETQLRSLRNGTLMKCPTNLQEMHQYLADHYVVRFESWSTHVQEQLKRTWDEYLRPDGLCALATRLKEEVHARRQS